MKNVVGALVTTNAGSSLAPAISAVRLRDMGFGKPLEWFGRNFGEKNPLRINALQKWSC